MDSHDDEAEKDPGAQKVSQNFDEKDYEGNFLRDLMSGFLCKRRP